MKLRLILIVTLLVVAEVCLSSEIAFRQYDAAGNSAALTLLHNLDTYQHVFIGTFALDFEEIAYDFPAAAQHNIPVTIDRCVTGPLCNGSEASIVARLSIPSMYVEKRGAENSVLEIYKTRLDELDATPESLVLEQQLGSAIHPMQFIGLDRRIRFESNQSYLFFTSHDFGSYQPWDPATSSFVFSGDHKDEIVRSIDRIGGSVAIQEYTRNKPERAKWSENVKGGKCAQTAQASSVICQVLLQNRSQVARYLKEGGEPSVRSISLETPLDFAMKGSDEDIALLLLQYGATSTFSPEPENLLYAAAYADFPRVIQAVVNEHSVDLDYRDRGGLTPLGAAVSNTSLRSVRKLIELGADAKQSLFYGEFNRSPLVETEDEGTAALELMASLDSSLAGSDALDRLAYTASVTNRMALLSLVMELSPQSIDTLNSRQRVEMLARAAMTENQKLYDLLLAEGLDRCSLAPDNAPDYFKYFVERNQQKLWLQPEYREIVRSCENDS